MKRWNDDEIETICEPYQALFIHQLELHLPTSIWALKVIASSDFTILESPAAKTISGERIEVLACVKTEKTEKYIWWQHGSLVFVFKWHQGYRIEAEVESWRFGADSAYYRG